MGYRLSDYKSLPLKIVTGLKEMTPVEKCCCIDDEGGEFYHYDIQRKV